MPYIITKDHMPQVHAAFRAIQEDSGAHLIGTVYPGEAVDLERFEVPDAWGALIGPAELALTKLRALSEEDWQTFVIGEMSEAEAIERRQGDLAEARKLLDDFFDGWQPDDAPNPEDVERESNAIHDAQHGFDDRGWR